MRLNAGVRFPSERNSESNAPRYPDADALLSDLRSDGNLTPALRRMQFAQRRMLSRTWAEAEAAEQYASSLVAALRTLGGDPNTIEAGTAPSSQFDSGCSKFNAEQVTEAYDNTE